MRDFLLARIRRFRKELTLVGMTSLLASLSTLALPWFGAQLVGGLVAPIARSTGAVAILLVLALTLTTLCSVAAAILSARTAGRILAELRLEAYEKIQHLPMGYHDASRQGDMLAVMTYEVTSLAEFLTSTLAKVPSMVLTAIGATAALFYLNPLLAACVPLLMPTFFILLKLTRRRLRILGARHQQTMAELMFLAESHLEMLPATKAFAAEDGQAAVYRAAVERARQSAFSYSRINAIIGPAFGMVAALAVVGLLLFAGSEAVSMRDDPVRLLSFLFYAALLSRPVGSLAGVFGQVQLARGTLHRIGSVFRQASETGYEAGRDPGRLTGHISFENVSFGYGGRKELLHSVSLDIRSGETVAITGENGAGKSTLINLLMRFYEPSHGRILLDGHDIAAMQVQGLRRNFGVVPQRALLFNGTVRENILFGSRNGDEASLLRACELAQALDFITELPHVFETRIGDHGVRLSGGQRQRIALARALVEDPPILILDEATSMYDLEGEAAFVDACQTALKGRTVLIVTHRPASLALADRVVVVGDGQVREEQESAG